MAFEIIISPRAEKNFESIQKYLLNKWGEKVTSDFVNIIFEFLKILREQPKIGSLEIKENLSGLLSF